VGGLYRGAEAAEQWRAFNA